MGIVRQILVDTVELCYQFIVWQGHVPDHKRRVTTELAPGTTLGREYNGITYRVMVMDDGRFELNGHPFKSLSKVAREITGTVYSGPVFFGLKPSSRDRKAAQA